MATIMAERGIKLLWRGRADSVLIGDDDADAWDTVLKILNTVMRTHPMHTVRAAELSC